MRVLLSESSSICHVRLVLLLSARGACSIQHAKGGERDACSCAGARIQANAGANTRVFGGQIITPAAVLSGKMMPPHEFQVRCQQNTCHVVYHVLEVL